MKQFINKRKMLVVSLVSLLAAILTGPVLAGGWGTIEMDELPGEIHAGENVHLNFMVRQHGQTPVHFLGDSDIPIEPVISGTNVKTGETVEFTAVADKSEVGRFTAEIVFPSSGQWNWTITPKPLAGQTKFESLTILPAVAVEAPVVESSTSAETTATTAAAAAESGRLAAALPWAGGLLIVAGAAMMGVLISRRRRAAVVVEAGD